MRMDIIKLVNWNDMNFVLSIMPREIEMYTCIILT